MASIRRRRTGPVPDPWKERFAFEAMMHSKHPHPTTRIGAPIKATRRKPRGTVDVEKLRARTRGLIWK